VGGLPLGRFYPELADCMLLCATEMSRKAEMDAIGEVVKAPAAATEQAEVLA
jgi:glycine dehydrogenase subunit 1